MMTTHADAGHTMGMRSKAIKGEVYRILVPAIVALCASTFPAHAEADWKMYRGEHFAMKLPPGFEVKTSRPVQDFEVLTVENAGTAYVGIYIGNHPTFPSLQRAGQNELTTFKANEFEMISVWRDVELLGREILIKLNRSEDWPSRLHVWTAVLPPEQLRIAEKIVSSVTILP